MERKVGTFGLADFCIGNKRKRHNFLDDVSGLIVWENIEILLQRKLNRNKVNTVGVKAYPALVMFKVLLLQA